MTIKETPDLPGEIHDPDELDDDAWLSTPERYAVDTDGALLELPRGEVCMKYTRDINTVRKMCKMAQDEYRFDIQWGVVNSGNALCLAIFRTKKEAEQYKRKHACAYVVVRVVIQPMYDLTRRDQ